MSHVGRLLVVIAGTSMTIGSAAGGDRDPSSPNRYAIYQGRALPKAAFPYATRVAPRGAVADYPVLERDSATAGGDPRATDENWFGYVDPYPYPGGASADESVRLYELRKRMVSEERARLFNLRDMQDRKQRALSASERATKAGVAALRSGQFQEAVVSLALAADLNQGDPASRIHLAQARLALGQYPLAGAAIRRALELQPRLAYLPLNLDNYFPDTVQSAAVDAFARNTRGRNATGDEYLALGFFEMQRGNTNAAHQAFRSARKRLPRLSFLAGLVTTTTPAAQSAGTPSTGSVPTKIRPPADAVASRP